MISWKNLFLSLRACKTQEIFVIAFDAHGQSIASISLGGEFRVVVPHELVEMARTV